ncbi:hypothetical protein BPTFM16_02266 [Altererythrobacter insulae]|nr:hypothetical protein BPTFM16_02266 [Altererythrobacter insulae]
MDRLSGHFDAPDFTDASNDYDLGDEDYARDLPPAAIGQDERRMQVRAYNHWASQLGERNFPSIEELEPENLPDFGPYSVLLDFSTGIEDPAVQYLGGELAEECGAEGPISKLSDVPSRSLLSRITDHYLQILANQAPIGFEAEFVNQRGSTIMYRGILLPYSSDNDTIDFIYGVINWKEVADQDAAEELLLEIDQALETEDATEAPVEDEPVKREAEPVADWADGPSAEESDDDDEVRTLDIDSDHEIFDPLNLPEPAFGEYMLDGEDLEEDEDEANYDFASLSDHVTAPTKKAQALDLGEFEVEADVPLEEEAGPVPFEVPAEVPAATEGFAEDEVEPDGEATDIDTPIRLTPPEVTIDIDVHDSVLDEAHVTPFVSSIENDDDVAIPEIAELPDEPGLYDYLAIAREAAQTAQISEDRSRKALYDAVGQAFDFSIAAQDAPEDYAELLEDSGLEAQARAPMTPIVKLVFGVDYDKTRVTEYAAVLSYAHRVGISKGGLADYLSEASGGLKGVVNAERRWRKEQAGQNVEPDNVVRSSIANKLRQLDPQDFSDIDDKGGEFGLVMIHRTEDGEIVVLGEVEQDIPLIERAARKLLG